MNKLSRRGLFGFGAAVLPGALIADQVERTLEGDFVPPAIDPKIVEAAHRTASEFPVSHFEKCNRFDYNKSGQMFCVTGLDRVSQIITECCVGDEVPTFGITDKNTWHQMLSMIQDMITEGGVATGVIARMFRDLKSRHLWWDGLPFFWEQALVDESHKLQSLREQYGCATKAYIAAWKESHRENMYGCHSEMGKDENIAYLANEIEQSHPRPKCIYIVN